MYKKFAVLMTVVLMASMILAACGTPATTVAPTTAAEPKLKVCEVTDTGGIDDKSFNATAWKGVQDAIAQYGIEGKYLESKEVADYAKNINAFIEEKCDLIIPVGFFLTDDTKAAAEANPDQKFSIVDVTYDPVIANVQSQVFQTDEAAFLAGYLSAGMTKTGKVATYGGFPIPTVTIFMDGFARGVAYYNEVKGTNVEVLGWDINDPEKGTFSSSFDDAAKGKELGNNFLDEGADIILPVAGPVGQGTMAAVAERGTGYVIGVDSDWELLYPDSGKYILTSILKKMDATVLDAVKQLKDGTFKGGNVIGSLANKGVDIAPLYDLESSLPEGMAKELDDVRAKLLDGTIKLSDSFKLAK